MLFKKKPVVIEAFKWGTDQVPQHWIDHGAIETLTSGSALISTLEGKMEAKVGDYIIRGVRGELYPCKPDIFAMTYEKVDGGQVE